MPQCPIAGDSTGVSVQYVLMSTSRPFNYRVSLVDCASSWVVIEYIIPVTERRSGKAVSLNTAQTIVITWKTMLLKSQADKALSLL